MREKPDELDGGFIPSFDDADLLGTGELFVAGNALDSVPKSSRQDRNTSFVMTGLNSFRAAAQATLRLSSLPNSRVYPRPAGKK